MESSGRTLVCSVVFLDIVEYSKKPVAEQLELKQAFNRILTGALAQVAPRDRLVLDTGDGAAVTFLGDPEEALFVATGIRDAVRAEPPGGLRVRMGVNLGPVRLVRDINGQINIIGDGINVAQRVMGFAQPGQLLASRSFYEVVSCLSRDYAKLFKHEGSRTDKHVREHEVYSVGSLPARHLADAGAPHSGGFLAALTAPGPFGLNRATFVIAPLLFLLIVGTALRVKKERVQRAAEAAALEAPASPRPAPLPVPAAGEAARAAAPGHLVVVALPWGEVFVDGRSRGVTPPLRRIELKPGPHLVEIRNANFPPRIERVEVRPGEEVRIKHRFG